jgi:citrate synthase
VKEASEGSPLLTREEAMKLMNVKSSTLYAYVSRGLIKTVRHEDGRRSLYSRADVERVARRRRGRPSREDETASTLRWGAPVLFSAVTQITPDGPRYRNRLAVDLANADVPFEPVVQFLMTGLWQDAIAAWPELGMPQDVRALLEAQVAPQSEDIGNLMGMLVFALGMQGRGTSEISDGQSMQATRLILLGMAGCTGFLGPQRAFVAREPGESIAVQLIRAGGGSVTPEAVRVMNCALVLLADNELAPATFAARVAASTNADLYSCVATAIGSHIGPSTGTATRKIETTLLGEPMDDIPTRLELVRDFGVNVFGFNHPLYPDGDPRANLILARVSQLPAPSASTWGTLDLLERARARHNAHPGVALALVTLSRALGLPDGTATAIWILSRTAGWVAHALEQRTQAFLMRPRARHRKSGTVTMTV